MKTLVIVDDEPSVIHGLSNYVDWHKQGIELVGTADDGDVGLALIRTKKPDIVLTDVQMPAMDGIRMAAEIHVHLPATKIVFISGYNDANYLKSALQIHAVDYIFKPIGRTELHAVMERVVAALDEEQRARDRLNEMQVKLTQSMPLLREKFLLSLVSDPIDPNGIHEKLEFLGLPLLNADQYIVLTVVIDDLTAVMESRTERDKQILSYSVLNIIQELIDLEMRGTAFEKVQGEYTAILTIRREQVDADGGSRAEPGEAGFMEEGGNLYKGESTEQILLTLAESIRSHLRNWLKLSVTIGVGEQVGSLSELPLSYKRAREAADQKWYLGKNRILTMNSMESGGDGAHQQAAGVQDRVLAALQAGDSSRMRAELSELFRLLEQNRRHGFRYGRNASLQLIVQAGQLLLERNGMTEEWENREAEVWSQVLSRETMQDLIRYTESRLIEVCEFVQEKRRGRAGGLIQQIHLLIEDKYAQNLTVADIAEDVYLSPTYVRLLFKQETGETLFEYLTKVRIEKAKELLKDPRIKFYEVCSAVGYSDPSHFSKLFKKMTGCTPSVYKERQL